MFDDEDYANQLCDEIKVKEEKKINTLNDWVKDFNKKVDEKIVVPKCKSIKEMCDALSKLFHSKQITSMLLLIT